MGNRKIFISALVLLWVVAIIMMINSTTKLTYLEYSYVNDNADDSIVLMSNRDYLEQSFICPYQYMRGVSLKIGTFTRDNNSIWNIAIVNRDNGRIIYDKDYNASLISDKAFHFFEFDKNIKVETNKEYLVRISVKRVNENSSLAFFTGDSSESTSVIYNGQEQAKALCLAIYGGDSSNWWLGFEIILAIAGSIALARAYYLRSNGKRLFDDRVFGSIIVGILVVALLGTFSVSGSFTDEWDNIRGGMIVYRGGVIYRDYVTQHTPVMYYLCGVFALLGARSLQQFRLSYYLFEAFIWGGLYCRHVKHFGYKKMLILTILECVFVTSVLGDCQGYMILGDGMQGLCMVALLLEFLEYYKDKSIDWDRSIIVSASIWCSVGSAFISAYAIVFVVVAVVCLEIKRNVKDGTSFIGLMKRYYKLATSMIVPLVVAILYFKINHSLIRGYEQFYRFNREVYSQYISFGKNIFEPFVKSEQNFFGIISDKINLIVAAKATNADILQLVIVSVSTSVIVTMCIRKRIVESSVLFAVMVFSATRGYGFHGIAAWYVSIMIIALFGKELSIPRLKDIAIPTTVIFSIFLLSIYAKDVGTNLLYEQKPISEIECRVISLTEDKEDILIDAYCCDSVYFLYKNRYPANRACYMLPWYMDWYEQETVDDLVNNNPRVVVYNPDIDTWGYTYYTNSFYTELKENYTQLSDNPEDGWKYRIWIRNE